MKIAKLHILSLMVAALVAGGHGSAAAGEIEFKMTESDAFAAAQNWRNEIKQSFEVPRKHEEYLKAMRDSSEKLRLFLTDRQCRDGAQAKVMEKFIHDAFHTLYGRVVADINHGVDLNCRSNHLTVTFHLVDFTPTAKLIAAEKSADANKATHEIETAAKRIFGNWATAVAPALTDKSKKIEDVRANATRAADQIKPQLRAISCPDEKVALTGAKVTLAEATKTLSQNFSGYSFDVSCDGKKLNLIYNFAKLARKGP
jgi:hypothetical protein